MKYECVKIKISKMKMKEKRRERRSCVLVTWSLSSLPVAVGGDRRDAEASERGAEACCDELSRPERALLSSMIPYF